MSDQSPPRPKPGSLRDRIAAFENKGGATPSAPPGPPPPRPKPSGLQWKPQPSSPTASSENPQSSERKPPSTGGMSAADAMESIGRGGSLKERMAALQGRGAFGGAPPPVAPKPNIERPKWKPPPAVPAPVVSDDESKEGISRVDVGGRAASRSPPPRAGASPTPENQGSSNREDDAVAHEGGDGTPDPEEERQRRAAIAARMARLGGARFGMGPPIFGPKPTIRKTGSVASASESRDETPVDQSTVQRESSEGLVSSPRDLPTAVSPDPELIAETERKDVPGSPPSVPSPSPTSMPVPAGPRRAAPPRKKAVKNAPTAISGPPTEEPENVAVQSPSFTDEPSATAERATHDVYLSTGTSQEIDEAAETGVTHEEHLNVAHDIEQHVTPSLIPTETLHGHTEEPKNQEAEELVEETGGRVERESIPAAAEDQETPFEQPPEVGEVDEEDEEERRQRVAAKLSQMGAFNPLAGPPPVPQRASFDEPTIAQPAGPLDHDVEDEVKVETEEDGTTTHPPSTMPARQNTVQSIKHDDVVSHVETDQDNAKVDTYDQLPVHRDGEHAVAAYTEGQVDSFEGHTFPEFSETEQNKYDSVHVMTPGDVYTKGAEVLEAPGTVSLAAEAREPRLRGDKGDILEGGATVEAERNTFKDEVGEDEVSPPRITPPIPPPPVNLRSKPTSPTSPPLSPPLQMLRGADEECPASPDIPPRPIPPPGRSGSVTGDVPSPPPRRSIPPPPRRTSVRVTEETLSSPPPAPTSPRPVSRRPATPPIITTLSVPEQSASEEHESDPVGEKKLESQTPRPEANEDEASVRRRSIAERMARLGSIRFGAPPAMNPLSRPPLPPAPPPTSIPPDETESEGKEEEGQGVREEGDEDEAARRQRIVAKLAGMGGMRLGMLPPTAGLPPATTRFLATRQEDSESEDTVPPVPIPAPPQRPPPTRKPPPPIEMFLEQEEQSRRESRGMSDDGVQVEAEESEIEEVCYSDAEAVTSEGRDTLVQSAQALPTPPPRMTSRSPPPGRPPMPMISPTLLGRRPSAATSSNSRQTSLDEWSPGETFSNSGRGSEDAVRSQSEYVMVEAEDPDEDGDNAPTPPPPPRRNPMRGPARSIPLPPPPPPSAIDPPEALTSSAQWELPSIPQGVKFGEGSEMAMSQWSEDSTAVHVPPPPENRGSLSKAGLPSSTTTVSVSVAGSGAGSGRRSVDQQQQQLTTEELMAIWNKVGVHVAEAAETLFEKSKRALVGDGSYAGFVRAVLAQVPGAMAHRPAANASDDDWGYMVYAQTGNAVQRRVSDILPGDVIVFSDAKLKGHKGLHAYLQTPGAGAAASTGEGGGVLVGIVSEFDSKKSKVRVWQANQHVGQQTAENVSYRLEDLKSGQVKVYRVLEV